MRRTSKEADANSKVCVLWAGIILGCVRATIFTSQAMPNTILFEFEDSLTALRDACKLRDPWLQYYRPIYESGAIVSRNCDSLTADELTDKIIATIKNLYAEQTLVAYNKELTHGYKH
jgi:hypothetical protein